MVFLSQKNFRRGHRPPDPWRMLCCCRKTQCSHLRVLVRWRGPVGVGSDRDHKAPKQGFLLFLGKGRNLGFLYASGRALWDKDQPPRTMMSFLQAKQFCGWSLQTPHPLQTSAIMRSFCGAGTASEGRWEKHYFVPSHKWLLTEEWPCNEHSQMLKSSRCCI